MRTTGDEGDGRRGVGPRREDLAVASETPRRAGVGPPHPGFMGR